MFSIHRMLFLALKKVWITKITPQVLATQLKEFPQQNFGFLPYPTPPFGKPCCFFGSTSTILLILCQCLYEVLPGSYMATFDPISNWSNSCFCIIFFSNSMVSLGICLFSLGSWNNPVFVEFMLRRTWNCIP